MQLFIYLDLGDIEPEEWTRRLAPVREALAPWAAEQAESVTLVDDTPDDGEPCLGIHFEANRKPDLKGPLAFLYSLARQHKVEWVLGIRDPASGTREEVCYFGFEEGRPDPFEVANYVGL